LQRIHRIEENSNGWGNQDVGRASWNEVPGQEKKATWYTSMEEEGTPNLAERLDVEGDSKVVPGKELL
jgi:hypothetical protein